MVGQHPHEPTELHHRRQVRDSAGGLTPSQFGGRRPRQDASGTPFHAELQAYCLRLVRPGVTMTPEAACPAAVSHAVLVTDKVMGSDEFFGLIEEFLSPRMAELGYHGIGGSENDQPQSRGMLTRLGARSHGADFPGRAPFLRYDFGFEAGSTDVRRLLNPDDPESADEIWLSYEPVTEELDLSAWHSIAEGRVDWDPRSDTGPCSRSELRRRLEEIGRAVADFARSQGGPPSTS